MGLDLDCLPLGRQGCYSTVHADKHHPVGSPRGSPRILRFACYSPELFEELLLAQCGLCTDGWYMRVRYRDIRNRCVNDMRVCVCVCTDWMIETLSPSAVAKMVTRNSNGKMRDHDLWAKNCEGTPGQRLHRSHGGCMAQERKSDASLPTKSSRPETHTTPSQLHRPVQCSLQQTPN